jgi:methionyl-tRNA formyltransferase
MRVTAGLDSGPVYLQAIEPITAEDTYGTLAARLERLGGELLVETLDAMPPTTDQDDAEATYAEKITAADRRLDSSKPAVVLDRIVRALTPHIGAQLEFADGTLLGVRRTRVLEDGPPQAELSLAGPRPVLGCAQGALELVSVHPSGRREMSGEDYLRGLHG